MGESKKLPKKLQVLSYLAPNWFEFYQAVLMYLNRTFAVEMQLHQGECDPLEDPLLLEDQLDLAFICGLPLIRHCQSNPNQLQTLVAPVMLSQRYQQRPIYFSDVIVNAASHLRKFEDLAGTTLCYNDPGSNSGYNLLFHRLIQGGHSQHFFSKVIQSGSHQRSIRWVVDGIADCAAIDSVVLEQELRDYPELRAGLRVVEVIGPCPMPPLVAAKHLGLSFIEQMQIGLLQPDIELQAAMTKVGVQCFCRVNVEDYTLLADVYDGVLKSQRVKGQKSKVK